MIKDPDETTSISWKVRVSFFRGSHESKLSKPTCSPPNFWYLKSHKTKAPGTLCGRDGPASLESSTVVHAHVTAAGHFLDGIKVKIELNHRRSKIILDHIVATCNRFPDDVYSNA